MIRLNNWQSSFSKWIERAHGMAFEWGSWDCGIFVVTAIQAQTGIKVYEPMWEDERSAVDLMTRAGSLKIFHDTLEQFDCLPCHPNEARDGDPLLLRQGKRLIGAIKYRGGAIAPGKCGIEQLPISQAEYAWHLEGKN
tara:strand:- start:736 stop:1149 length:414 start_codon:yes stop_codon:yes gene_type:complete